jgi:hypothetical protein
MLVLNGSAKTQLSCSSPTTITIRRVKLTKQKCAACKWFLRLLKMKDFLHALNVLHFI